MKGLRSSTLGFVMNLLGFDKVALYPVNAKYKANIHQLNGLAKSRGLVVPLIDQGRNPKRRKLKTFYFKGLMVGLFETARVFEELDFNSLK